VARVDLQITVRQQWHEWLDSWLYLLRWLRLWRMENPKGFGLYL
jgi:hypothetical protein